MTPVKNQNPFGFCGSFGFIAAIEASVLKHNLLPNETAQTLDFSERHLLWFVTHAVLDPLGNTAGDDVVYPDHPEWDDQSSYLYYGTKDMDFFKGLTAGFGPVREEEAPYSELVESYSRHKNTDKNFKAFLEETSLENTWKKATEKSELFLKKAHTSLNSGPVNSRKRLIMEYGAVQQEIFMDLNYMSNDFALLTDSSAFSPHSVVLVGWDDTYSRDHFGNPETGNLKPKQDGAFLVKNSYGSDWGNQGYFWLSYEDYLVQKTPGIAFEMEPVSKERNIYMYDGGLNSEFFMFKSGNKAAAVYAVPNDAKPQRLTKFTMAMDVRENPVWGYFQIYRNPQDPKDPESGETLLKEKMKTDPNASYMVFEEPEEEVVLYPGDRFTIVLDIPAQEGGGLFLAYYDADGEEGKIKYIYSCSPGESFVYVKDDQGNYVWQDQALLSGYRQGLLRLRAYTRNLTDIRDAEFAMASHVPWTGSAQEPPVSVVYAGNELTFGTDYTLEYRKNTEPGMASVIVRGIGEFAMEQELFFEIAPLTIQGVGDQCSYTGKEISPEVTVTFGESTLVKDRDYFVTYRNNRNPGCPEVIVTGMNVYAIKEVLTFRIIDKSEPEKEDSGSSSPIPTVIPQAYASARHASPNTSDPFSSAKHWMVFMTSGLTALGSLLVLRHRR